jgi:hypothetical protein
VAGAFEVFEALAAFEVFDATTAGVFGGCLAATSFGCAACFAGGAFGSLAVTGALSAVFIGVFAGSREVAGAVVAGGAPVVAVADVAFGCDPMGFFSAAGFFSGAIAVMETI